MQKYFTLIVSIALFLFSCSKPVVEKPIPESEADLSRTLIFSNGSPTKSSAYFGKDFIEARAEVANGFVYITLDASPKNNGANGELIQLKLDQSHLQTGFAKTYSFTDPSAKIISGRYLYIKKDISGGMWMSITDTQIGVAFEGQLKITAYDANRKLIAGEFQVGVRQLIADPTLNTGSQIDPLGKCDLTLSGGFKNVVLK